MKSNPHNEGVLYETDPVGLYEVGVPHWERLQTELPPDVFAAAVERGKTLDYDAMVAEFSQGM